MLIRDRSEIKSSKPKLLFKVHHFCEGRPFRVRTRDGHCGYLWGTAIVGTRKGRLLWVLTLGSKSPAAEMIVLCILHVILLWIYCFVTLF